jgi:photosystem II stability/assembly factor-like uncharacterized protein
MKSILSLKTLTGFRCLLVCCLNAAAQTAAWERQRTGTLAWLHAVYFLDQNRGWAVGSKGTLLATNDGGKSWHQHSSSTQDVIRDIFFIDERNGWTVCEVNEYELKEKDDPRAYLMRTTDSGETWQRIEIKGLDVDARFTRVVFSRGGRGWVFGEAGLIYATRDGGDTWTQLQSPTRHLLLGGTFIDDDRGWLVGAGATIIQTSDGGDTWYQARLPQTALDPIRFAAASFISNRIGWAVGSQGTIFRTDNGGRTWLRQNSGINADLYDVKFINGQEGWAVGAEGTVIHTTDGGLSWTKQISATTHPLERVFIADRGHGWAVGFGGTIVVQGTTEAPRLSGKQ